MKRMLLVALMCCCGYLHAQNLPSISIEDKKMDTYLTGRKPATLTILLKNLPDSIKKVTVKYTLVQLLGSFQATKYTETDAAGTCKILLDENLPYQQIWLDISNYLYTGIYVNTGLTVNIDVQKVPKEGAYMIADGVTYSGYDGEFNTIMNKNGLFEKEKKEALANSLRTLCQARRKYATDVFTFKTDSVLKLMENIDSEFIIKYPAYKWAIKNETLSQFYGDILTAYWGEAMPGSVYNELNMHQPMFISNDGVLYYQYLTVYTQSQHGFKKNDMVGSTLKLYDSLYTRQRADVLKLFLLESYKDSFADAYPRIIKSITTNWCKGIATNELSKAIAKKKRIDSLFSLSKKISDTTIGTPLVKLPFDASLYKMDTIANVDDFITNLKAKFPGKAIIIDFWATWCAPCLADLPYSKSLHEANKNLPIEYVYLCTSSGSNMNIWKNRVGELQIPGTHIFMNDKIISKLKSAFNSEGGFPTYVVIDIKGKVNQKTIPQMQLLNNDQLKQIAGL